VRWYNGTEWNCARTEFEKTACSSGVDRLKGSEGRGKGIEL
jgi:hypothetical protein